MIVIAPIAEIHAEGFYACLDAVAREGAYLGQTEAPPIERVTAFVFDNVANDFPQFVALDGDVVVGWSDAIPHWAGGLKHRASLGMAVLATHRRQGIGRLLLVACIEKSRENGIARIDLEVRADNEPAIRLYRSFGFVEEGRRKKGLRHGGVYYDTIDMGLLL